MNICLSCEGVTATAATRCGHCGAYLLPVDSVHYPTRRGEADAGNPLLGSVIDGKYRLEGVLGRGGLGTVFQAEHVGSLMKVAVKLLHPRFSERPEYRKALLPEARRAATVTNERCARLLDVGDTSHGGTYLAMELVDGDTLEQLVAGGPLAPAHAVDILVQIAEALVAIHAAGLVHCDLAPRNVMVATRNGSLVAKVLDFGIARSVSRTAGDRLEHGEFKGFANPAFSAPEHLAGQEVDQRADLYSLGALAWFLLTGKAPIDERDASRAARAAVVGELDDWPGVSGVPRRLLRLIERCLSLDREARPQSAAGVLRELLGIRGARRPALARIAITAAAASVVFLVAAFFEVQEPFLRPVFGSPLVLRDRLPQEVRYLQSSELATLQLRFGGFRAGALRLDVAQRGNVLRQQPLAPQVDAAGDTLTLSVAQPEWQLAVRSLAETSRSGPVDLSFVVPGRAPLGSIRVRIDDEPPELAATLVEAGSTDLTAATAVDWRVSDGVGLLRAEAFVVLAEGGRYVLPLEGGEGRLPVGLELAKAIDGIAEQPGGRIHVEAEDVAGNTRTVDVGTFAACDVRAPAVRAVNGPAGEGFLPRIGGTVRMRVELAAAEPGCELVIQDLDGREVMRRQLADGTFHDLELAAAEVEFPSGLYDFVVVDRFGNRTGRKLGCTVRDRSMQLRFVGEPPSFVKAGDELVIRSSGAEATLRCSAAYRVAGLGLVSGPTGAPPAPARYETTAPGTTAVKFVELPPGSYQLEITLEERDASAAPRVREVMPLRVLPDVVELRVAKPLSRFLEGVEGAGVLERIGDGYREGPGWAIDPELLRYVHGRLLVGFGADTLVPTPLPAGADPTAALLPEFVPLPGHNLLAVQLHDVLGRAVRVYVGDRRPPQRSFEGRPADVVAEFYWHNQPPEPIGEELLVEHGQPAKLRLRFPLPYVDADRADLRLGLSESEVVASHVEAEGDAAAIATFVLPFDTWRIAARLADETREAYGRQILRQVKVSVRTPVGRYEFELAFRTTRSTLRPVRLGELTDEAVALPAELADLRFVPVLAPAGPFAEPIPAAAPPRALFRPQVAVAVRNIRDFLLLDRELTCAEARAIVAAGLPRVGNRPVRQLVHADDPLQAGRLSSPRLLPAHVIGAPPAEPVTGVDFFQAYTCCRLLGLVLADDPELFRLPMGSELELAAFGEAAGGACNGPAAAGRPIAMREFVRAADRFARGRVVTAAESRAAGDHAAGDPSTAICGLDFGVREWVGDLPHIEHNELLLSEWIEDHEGHLARIRGFASGAVAPPGDLADRLRTVGVVRGLALGELEGLIDVKGRRLEVRADGVVPGAVPGVLRTEQLRRDGRDLLSTGPDPRLRRVGFRLAGTPALVRRIRGLR